MAVDQPFACPIFARPATIQHQHDGPAYRGPQHCGWLRTSNILPRQTHEHRLNLAETISLEGRRNSWNSEATFSKRGIDNYFPAQSGGEYIFDLIKVNPFTFEPQEAGWPLTPLRAYAHDVPKYYIQNFGSQSSHPDTNEYAAFLQDTIRATSHLAVSLGVRYDLQTFTKKGLLTNPLWPDSGKDSLQPE